jgi:predicted DNA-binding transcriptional regulator AlpA
MVRHMPNELLTSPQVAHRLGCSTRTVHRLVTSEDLIPAHRLPGPNGAFLFESAAVEELRIQRGATAEDAA